MSVDGGVLDRSGGRGDSGGGHGDAAAFGLSEVEVGIAGTSFAGRLTHLAVTDSTSTLAIRAAQAGAAAGGVWVADEQTAGRGRGGHAWHSVVGDGLYVSVLLRPKMGGLDALKISLAAGLAAKRAALAGMQTEERTPGAKAHLVGEPERPKAEALGYLEAKAGTYDLLSLGCLDAKAQSGVLVDLRWPNDLMVTGKGGVERKFGGILTETAIGGGDGALMYAVVGIGMNLNHAELPEELREIATSLRMVTGERISRERVLVDLLRGLEAEMALLEAEVAGRCDLESICVRFERGSTWVRGVRVRVEEEGGYTGVTDGLDVRGLLRVRLEDGTGRLVRHGGVRRV